MFPFLEKRFAVEKVGIYHCPKFPVTRFRYGKIICLVINIGYIESLTEIKICSTVQAVRRFYSFSAGMIYFYFVHISYYLVFPNDPTFR